MTRPVLLRILTMVQNSRDNHGRDIMTFAGFCSDDAELRSYVLQAWLRLSDVARKVEILKAARAAVAA